MSSQQHIIDPDGEVTIILRNANAPFAVMDSDTKTAIEQEDDDRDPYTDDGPDDDRDVSDSHDPSSEQAQAEAHFQVSAKHLMLASPVFKRLLKGPWKEGSALEKQGSVKVDAENWDSKCFLILLNILHCRHRELPHQMNVEQLAKIAVLVD